jgi:hypothetical protein
MLERWRPRALLLQPQALWDGERGWPGFADWCAAHPGRSCELWLAAPLLHELVCAADLPLADDAAALAWARPLLQHYHGEAALAWPLAAWQHGRTRGVSALHGLALDGLRESARQHRVRLRAVRPWWSQVLRLALRRHAELRAPQARLLVVEGDRLVVLDLQGGQLQGLAVRRLAGAGRDALQHWCRDNDAPGLAPAANTVAVGYGLDAPEPAGPLPAGTPDIRIPEPLHPGQPAPRWLSGAGA